MTINIEATIRWKGYNPNDLSPRSNRRVWAVCNDCGKCRWVEYKHYSDLCRSCSHKGKKHSIESRKKMSEVKIGKCAGKKHHFFGKHLTKEHKQKLSKSLIGKYTGENSPNYGKRHSEGSRKKISEAHVGKRIGVKHHFFGKHLTKEHRQKLSDANSGKIRSEETRKKISEARIGKYSGDKHPMYGTHPSEETLKKRSAAMTGRIVSEESRRKVSAAHQGIPYDEWESFAKEQPYCPTFNEACRESNREKYGRKCFICGLPESENLTKTGKIRKLSVHHIDMNKQQGCDGKRWKLIPVCMYHHTTVHNDLWMGRIMFLLNSCWK